MSNLYGDVGVKDWRWSPARVAVLSTLAESVADTKVAG